MKIGPTSTTRTRTKNMRRAVALTPLLLNCVACALFIAVRPPATSLIEERERAERSGALSVSSADPYMVIAARPLRQWDEWHGGEAAWVKIIAVANGPAVFAAKRFGDRWAAEHAFSGQETYGRQSWNCSWIIAGRGQSFCRSSTIVDNAGKLWCTLHLTPTATSHVILEHEYDFMVKSPNSGRLNA